ncbi:tetratricopeptide repeat-containing sensor histidine kinase [Mucilaginibacter sp. BT774]|uniref:tetratricopeptide repeat-containing sensor histidine kinase n=1 Tax=Mucilaginibacter sp. BT774 TaxID=3062276 RepID=UPI002674462B|nr:tetratricopeptide repeat-containing sensor histidine kinase [Mucilaginibacter sp. BT774]MDO3627233.1 tetratricopeptide repeat-containing sensor histidine kinase [Mucilaginibacter sp. BT774]
MKAPVIFIFLFSALNGLSYSLSNSGHAQSACSNKTDSLKKIMLAGLGDRSHPSDIATINLINKLAAEFIEIKPDSTLYYGYKAIALSKKINYKAGIADGLVETGHANYFKGGFAQAKAELNEAISIYTDLNNKQGLSNAYTVTGQMYNMQADYKQALYYLNLARGIYEHQNNKRELPVCYKNIGMVYFGQGRHSAALDYYYKALFVEIEERNQTATADIYNNIGDVLQNMRAYPKALDYYNKALGIAKQTHDLLEIGTATENIGEVLLAQKHYDQAINYLSKALHIAIKQDDKDGISYISADLGLCYANKGQYDLALSYFNTALQTAAKYNIVYDKTYALIGFATLFNQQKDYQKAFNYASSGHKLAEQINNIWFRANAVFELNNSLAGLGKFEEAHKLSMEYIALQDSLNNDENIQKITSYNLEYEFASKQRKLIAQQKEKDELYAQRLKQERTNLIFLSTVLSGMVLIAAVYYKSKRRQQKINAVLQERNNEIVQKKADLDEQAIKLNDLNHLKDRLIAVLAHDLRAPLSTLRGLFTLLEDDTLTNDQFLDLIPQAVKKLEYTSDFLDTLLFWINSQMDNFDSTDKAFLIKDVVANETTNYCEQAALKGIRLIDNVSDNIIVAADPNSIRIVVRNLITNAIKFSRENDTITISTNYLDDNNILMSIKDTGIGMQQHQLDKLFKSKVDSGHGTNNESGTGMGLLFCKDLVEKCHGKIWVESQPGHGTEFFFTLPLGSFNEEAMIVS